MLWRTCYQRKDGSVSGLTFWAADLVAALEFERIWERMAGVKPLTLKAIGPSRFIERGGRTVLRSPS